MAVAWSAHATAREPREWALLDPDISSRKAGLGLGYSELRLGNAVDPQQGVSLELWGSLRTTRRRAFAELRQALAFRAFERSTFAFGAAQSLHAGVALGPLRIGSGFGLSPIGFDLSSSDATLHLLSPHAFLLVGFELGRLRLALRGEVQYWVRLFGREDAHLRSAVLEVALERAPPRVRPRIEPYVR